ncbi:MAG TPA: thioredoxin family protein [Erysipelothrix sp.]|nr:thioredoxin family protein [Erysipelothrix sp.]
MSKFLNDDVRKVLKEQLEAMQDDVQVKLYVDTLECDTCTETNQLLSEMSEVENKIKYELIDTKGDKTIGAEYGVTLYPTIVMLDKDGQDKGVRFYGIPAGHEINSLLASLIDMSGAPLDLDEETINAIKAIESETDIKVFVTLTCPHCPGAVTKAHRIAMLNPYVKASMVEAQTFGQLSAQHNVQSVPKIVINDSHDFVGNQPMEVFLETIQKAA